MKTMNLESAAEFLGLHPDTLQARAKSGQIPGAKIGKEWRFIKRKHRRNPHEMAPPTRIERVTLPLGGEATAMQGTGFGGVVSFFVTN